MSKKTLCIYFELLLDGLSELTDLGLDAVRELAVVLVQVPQKIGQRLCETGHSQDVVKHQWCSQKAKILHMN